LASISAIVLATTSIASFSGGALLTMMPLDLPWMRAVPISSPLWPSEMTSSVSMNALLELVTQPLEPRPAFVMLTSRITSGGGPEPARWIETKLHFCWSFAVTCCSSIIAWPCDANAVERTFRATVL
jgi:hypothetical protein